MKLSEIDRNFHIENSKSADGLTHYRLPCEPFDLYGVFYEAETERFVRMPSEVACRVSDNVRYLAANTAGGRVRFSTDSDTISLSVTFRDFPRMPHFSWLGASGFTLLEETEKGTHLVASFMPAPKEGEAFTGYCQTKPLPGGSVKNYILYFPNYNDIASLSLGLRCGSFVGHGKAYRRLPPILYYGSSITQGGCASRPDNAYQAFISKWSNTDFINLGFSGSAKGETEMVRYLSSLACSLFVCDYDYNAPTPEHLRETHKPLYRIFRKAQPDTPILFISRPSPLDAERIAIIRDTYETALREGDRHVALLDGKALFGKSDRENCTVDNVHPNDLGFYKMARCIYRKINTMISL